MTIGAPSGDLQYLFNTNSKGATTKINETHEKMSCLNHKMF